MQESAPRRHLLRLLCLFAASSAVCSVSSVVEEQFVVAAVDGVGPAGSDRNALSCDGHRPPLQAGWASGLALPQVGAEGRVRNEE